MYVVPAIASTKLTSTKSAVMLFRTLVESKLVTIEDESEESIWKIVDVEVTFQSAGVWNSDMLELQDWLQTKKADDSFSKRGTA